MNRRFIITESQRASMKVAFEQCEAWFQADALDYLKPVKQMTFEQIAAIACNFGEMDKIKTIVAFARAIESQYGIEP